MAWYTRPSLSQRQANRARTLQDVKSATFVAAGIALPIRKAGKVYTAVRPHATKFQIAVGAVALKGAVSSAVRSQPFYWVPGQVGYLVYLASTVQSRGGTSSGLPSESGVHPASVRLARPSASERSRKAAQKTRRAQGLVSRGSPSSSKRRGGRERLTPWCKVHKRRHWCRFTRK
jgi:hypothetical protein